MHPPHPKLEMGSIIKSTMIQFLLNRRDDNNSPFPEGITFPDDTSKVAFWNPSQMRPVLSQRLKSSHHLERAREIVKHNLSPLAKPHYPLIKRTDFSVFLYDFHTHTVALLPTHE